MQNLRAPVATGVLVLALAQPEPAAQEVLIERTVAIVGGAVITLADARTAVALHLVEVAGPQPLAVATKRLVERWLMLHEVDRFAPPEPPAAEIQARLAAMSARAGTPAAFAGVLAQGGFTEARLAQWVRDDLRITAYLDQRFAVAGVPAEAEVAAYYRAHADEFDAQGVNAAEAMAAARARLLADRRGRLIADWLTDLRRRTEVVELPLP
jgi:hypothetical protein